MKKLLCALLCTALLIPTMASFTPATAMTYKGSPAVCMTDGDANGDHTVNTADSLCLRRYLAGIVSDDTPDITTNCDINLDGTLNTLDALQLKLTFGGITSDNPVGKLTIGGADISEFTIFNATPDNENVTYAAKELAHYLNFACGTEPAITTVKPDGATITLIADTTGALGLEGYRITAGASSLEICGGYKRGTLYGVYDFLEKHVGWRFIGTADSVIYRRLAVSMKSGTTYSEKPVLEYRDVNTEAFDNESISISTYALPRKINSSTDRWNIDRAKYGFGISRLLYNAHSLYGFIPSVPEDKQPCLASPENLTECLSNMRTLLDERIGQGQKIGNEISTISCTYNPNDNYCTCRTCRLTTRDEESPSAMLVQFANKVADVLCAEYPGLKVYVCAYSQTRKPPKTFTCSDNIVVGYCWNGCENHIPGIESCTENGNVLGHSNTTECANFEKWASISKVTYVWYYLTNYAYRMSPAPNLFNILGDVKYLTGAGADGIYVDGNTNGATEDIKSYMMSRVLWDPDMTEAQFDRLLDEYLYLYYGNGWQEILEYLKMQDTAGDMCGCVLLNYEWPFDMVSREYYHDNAEKMLTLMTDAYKKTRNEVQQNRIRSLSVHIFFLCGCAQYDDFYVNGNTELRTRYKDNLLSMMKWANKHGILVDLERVMPESVTFEVNPMQEIYGISGSQFD